MANMLNKDREFKQAVSLNAYIKINSFVGGYWDTGQH
jgi:hypothetical protein